MKSVQTLSLRYFIYLIAVVATAGLVCVACKPASKVDEKPKYLWMCGDANFKRFSNRDSITYYLEKAKETGFNNIVVDVKPIYGKVLYKSRFAPELTTVDSFTCTRDWDYLKYIIDETHRLGMKATATACIFPVGSPYRLQGLCYEDSVYDGRTCLEYLSDGSFCDIRYDREEVAAFLNPALRSSQEYALNIIKEIVTNYDIDGISLDYCRYPGFKSDFSQASHTMFEDYLGKSIENFPDDIFTYDSKGEIVPGLYYNEWLAWRAGVIADFVSEVSDVVHSIKPDCELSYWAGSWIHSIEKNGQNWSSPRSKWCHNYPYGSEAYQKTGFVPALDNFIVGTYLERVYGPEDNESIEYGLNRADSIIMGDCHVIGSIQSINHSADSADPHNLVNAVKCCLEHSEGLMVFDIVHIINRDQWAQIKEGIDAYEQSK